MTLILLVGKACELVVTSIAVSLDEVSAAAKVLTDRGQRDTAETIWNTIDKTSPRVVAIRASVTLGNAPVGFNGIKFAVVFGVKEADIVTCQNDLFEHRLLGTKVIM